MNSLVFGMHNGKVLVPPVELDKRTIALGDLKEYGFSENYCMLFKCGWTETHLLWAVYFSHEQLPTIPDRSWVSIEEAIGSYTAEMEGIAHVQIPQTSNPRG